MRAKQQEGRMTRSGISALVPLALDQGPWQEQLQDPLTPEGATRPLPALGLDFTLETSGPQGPCTLSITLLRPVSYPSVTVPG